MSQSLPACGTGSYSAARPPRCTCDPAKCVWRPFLRGCVDKEKRCLFRVQQVLMSHKLLDTMKVRSALQSCSCFVQAGSAEGRETKFNTLHGTLRRKRIMHESILLD